MRNKLLIALVVFLLLLLLPFLFKKDTHRFVEGPALTELEYQEVSFVNQADSIKLGGMLFIPREVDSFPVAVIIHGSGSSRRNNPWYLSVVKHLQENGIAILLPDKRGSEQSAGSWEGVPLEKLATDTHAAIDFIKSQENLPYSAIGIIGMSQGGWIAPIVAAERDDLAFVVNMSGSLTTARDQLRFEEYHNLRPYTYDLIARIMAPLTAKMLEKKPRVAVFMEYDPVVYWKKVKIPVFIAYGEDDTNCPVEQSMQRLEKEGLHHFLARVYPHGGHAILDEQQNVLSPKFLNDLRTFILEHTQ